MPSESAPHPAAMIRLRPQQREAASRSRAVGGNDAAFAAIYDRHHQALYRYCRSILQHDADARDALQSTMTKAFAALRYEDRDFELRPWLFRIAHNEAISILRARRATTELHPELPAADDSMAQVVDDRTRLGHLRADLADLPERQRTALVLRELNGLSHQEIAGVLASTASAVKQTIFEARTALHACEEGRAMACEDVQRRLSDGDRRTLRGRALRAHLRSCAACRRFAAALAPPLPVGLGAALLAHLLPGVKGAAATTGASAGAAATTGASAAVSGGGGVVATLTTKAAVATAILATGAGATVVATQRTAAPPAGTPPSVSHRSMAGGAPARAHAPGAATPGATRVIVSVHHPAAAKAARDYGRAHQPGPRGRSSYQAAGARRRSTSAAGHATGHHQSPPIGSHHVPATPGATPSHPTGPPGGVGEPPGRSVHRASHPTPVASAKHSRAAPTAPHGPPSHGTRTPASRAAAGSRGQGRGATARVTAGPDLFADRALHNQRHAPASGQLAAGRTQDQGLPAQRRGPK